MHHQCVCLKFDGLTSVLPTIHPEGLKGRHHAVILVAVDLTARRDPMQTITPRMAGGILGNIHEEVLSNLSPVFEWRQAKLQRTLQKPKLDHLNEAWAPLQSTESGRMTRLTPWVCILLLEALLMPGIAELFRLAYPRGALSTRVVVTT